jgi:hypothetical protein
VARRHLFETDKCLFELPVRGDKTTCDSLEFGMYSVRCPGICYKMNKTLGLIEKCRNSLFLNGEAMLNSGCKELRRAR